MKISKTPKSKYFHQMLPSDKNSAIKIFSPSAGRQHLILFGLTSGASPIDDRLPDVCRPDALMF